MPMQYSICGKTRGVVSNVFLIKPVNENLGVEAPEEGLNSPPPLRRHWNNEINQWNFNIFWEILRGDDP